MKSKFFAQSAGLIMAFSRLLAAAPPPDFGPHVRICDPSMADIQQQVNAVFAKQQRAEFGSGRCAFLFKPGHYDLDLQAGFYTQVLGLGPSPDDVVIHGAVRSTAGWMHGNATVNFWRAMENLSVSADRPDVWAVSQGTWLRRIHLRGDLHLWDEGWSSGGFLADSKIDGRVVSGSQQQWISRNAEWGQWDGGVWNMVFVGAKNPPAGGWPAKPFTTIAQTPVICEKPYLWIDGEGRFSVMVPSLSNNGSSGITWGSLPTAGESISIDAFYIARPDHDTAASINAALADGKNLLLTPGIYRLDDSIRVTHADAVILGIGYPTLIPTTAKPALLLSDVDGIKVGGLIFDAGPIETPCLLAVGDKKGSTSHATDPICLFDIVARAGGATPGTTASFVTIHSNNVIGDNCWLWRADHGNGAGWTTNRVGNGLVVNGDDVTFYGLFVEHCQQYQTLWNGNGGRVYFYQSEMPYDPPSQAAWSHDGVKGYASYKVADSVTSHQAWGLGIYCYFTAAAVVADNAIETPASPDVKIHNSATVRLGGMPGSGISNVINNRGGSEMRVVPVRVAE